MVKIVCSSWVNMIHKIIKMVVCPSITLRYWESWKWYDICIIHQYYMTHCKKNLVRYLPFNFAGGKCFFHQDRMFSLKNKNHKSDCFLFWTCKICNFSSGAIFSFFASFRFRYFSYKKVHVCTGIYKFQLLAQSHKLN